MIFIKARALSLKRGFTLIELLVVIAIIGILAGIVLASLSNARGGANDSKVKGQLNSIRNAAAEQYFANNNSTYGPPNGAQTGLCTAAAGGSTMWVDTTTNMNGLITNTQTAVGATSNMDCGTSLIAYSVAVKLPSNTGFWCIDGTGASRGVASTTGVAYTGVTGSLTTAHLAAGSTNCN